MKDLVTLITESDEVIGEMEKVAAHRGEGTLHRAISVFLFRTNKTGSVEVLVQQRSALKIVGALQWANTACGNVWPGETYEDCARRRLAVELGIMQTATQLKLTPITKFRYQVRCNETFSENELDQVFAGWHDESLQPNPDEVVSTQWKEWELLKLQFSEQANSFDWAPWFGLLMTDDGVVTKLDEFLKLRK